MKQLPYNYDNFKKLHDKCEELQDLVISLNAQVTIQEAKVKPKPKKVREVKEDS